MCRNADATNVVAPRKSNVLVTVRNATRNSRGEEDVGELLDFRFNRAAHELTHGVLGWHTGIEHAIDAFAQRHLNTRARSDRAHRACGRVALDHLPDLGQSI